MSESHRKKLRITVAQVTPTKRNCNHCDERLQGDYCECWKARYTGNCKKCRKPIYEDDCLEFGTWNHTQCPRPIAREEYVPRSLILSDGKRKPDQKGVPRDRTSCSTKTSLSKRGCLEVPPLVLANQHTSADMSSCYARAQHSKVHGHRGIEQ